MLVTCANDEDRYNALIGCGMFDDIISYIAAGQPMEEIAYGLSLSLEHLQQILLRTPDAQRRVTSAMTTALALSSLSTLIGAKVGTSIDKETMNGLRHHVSVVKLAQVAINSQIEPKTNTGSQIVVHQTTIIGEQKQPPPLPPVLADVIEMEKDKNEYRAINSPRA